MESYRQQPYLVKKTRKTFSPEEDQNLRTLVQKYGESNWSLVAQNMPNRNARQCRDRWRSYLKPTNLSDEWTEEEDNILIQKYNEFGSRWTLIGKFLPQRSDIRIKQRVKLLLQHMNFKSMGIMYDKYQNGIIQNPMVATPPSYINGMPFFPFQPSVIYNKPVTCFKSIYVIPENEKEQMTNICQQEQPQKCEKNNRNNGNNGNNGIKLSNEILLVKNDVNRDVNNETLSLIPEAVGKGLTKEGSSG